MEWLNYHHLLYFWTVAREGSFSRAANSLHLAQPTLSSQIKKLEKSIGHALLDRDGRKLSLTDTGEMVFRYADEIFSLGQELNEVLSNRSESDKSRFNVGVQGAIPKLVAYQLLRPPLESESKQYHIVCYEGKLNELLGDLAIHRLDVVLADRPLSPDVSIRAYNHLLGKCGVTVFGTTRLRKKYQPGFPRSLDGAPMLMPTKNTSMRRGISQWLDENGIVPHVTHEFEDSAVLKVFGQAGHGLFVTPSAIEHEVCRQYSVKVVGRIPEVQERYYAISVERKLKHPGVLEIITNARTQLFGLDPEDE